jgi:hypothetical protein
MANGLAQRESCTICLPIAEDEYRKIMDSWPDVRQWIQRCFKESPELFPANFAQGFRQKDSRNPRKMDLCIWRVTANSDDQAYSIRPSFVMPWIIAKTEDVANGLFLRKFGVPDWALAHVFGHDPMFWYRAEVSLGANSVVGTTVRQAEIPEHLLADEHHQTCNGEKVYVATTVGGGCCLGAEVVNSASAVDLTKGYGVFKQEALDVQPTYLPKTVNTDGWKGTMNAWMALFVNIVIMRCFLHGWLKIRERSKHLKEQFFEIGDKVWDVYRAPDRKTCRQRLRALRGWASKHLQGGVLEAVLDLCAKGKLWVQTYTHPKGHRTSNMLDRVMRGMRRYFNQGQHLHSTVKAGTKRARAWALLYNFTPWSPQARRANQNYECPAERLNKHRYHPCWLQNLLISASLGGYRNVPPQNP